MNLLKQSALRGFILPICNIRLIDKKTLVGGSAG